MASKVKSLNKWLKILCHNNFNKIIRIISKLKIQYINNKAYSLINNMYNV